MRGYREILRGIKKIFTSKLINKSYRSVKSDSNESNKLIGKFNKLLETERVRAAVPKISLSLLREELVGDIKKR